MWALSEGASGIILACLVAAPALLAATLALLPWDAKRGPFFALVPAWMPACALLAIQTLLYLWLGLQEHTPRFDLSWIPAWGVSLSLRLDGLAWAYSLLTCFIGAAISLFSAHYVPHDLEERESRRKASTLQALLLVFISAMLGLVSSENLLGLYVFWEITTIASFLLIVFHIHEKKSLDSGLHSLVLTGGGGLFLFVALLLLGIAGGTSSLEELMSQPTGWLSGHSTAHFITFGVLVAAIAKSAQVPLHAWLPAAMVAPTPVSALLHSSTLVAAGVFLIARLNPLLFAQPGFGLTLMIVGLLSMAVGGLVAISRTNMKEILAWSTISQYGYVMVLLGLNAPGAAAFWIIQHAAAKSGLFLLAGAVHMVTGRQDVRDIGKLGRTHPILATLCVLLSAGMAGLPLTAGFWMKELFFEEVVGSPVRWLVLASVGASALTVLYMFRFTWLIFFTEKKDKAESDVELPVTPERKYPTLFLPSAVTALWVMVVGLWPKASNGLAAVAGESMVRHPVSVAPTLHWPPPPAFVAGTISLLLGTGLFFWMRSRSLKARRMGSSIREPVARTPYGALRQAFEAISARSFYGWFMVLLDRLGRSLALIQTGRLAHYLGWLAALPVLFAALLLPRIEGWIPFPPLDTWDSEGAVLFTLALAGGVLAIGVSFVRSHIGAILMAGGVGYVIAVIFALLHAPDIALVQVAVETATALLLIAALRNIPLDRRVRMFSPGRMRRPTERNIAVVLSVGLGLLVTGSIIALQTVWPSPWLGEQYLELARQTGVEAAVKGVLVDFRAVDTLGEAAVFASAILGALLLIERGKAHDD